MKKAFSIVLLAVFLASCSTVSPGSDAVVVSAERTRAISALTFQTLWKLEKENRLALWAVDHSIKHSVDATRKDAPLWIADITSAIAAYKAVKGAATQQSLLKSEESLLGHATEANKLATTITNALPTLNH